MTRRFPVHVSQTCSFQAGLWDHWTLEIRWPGRGPGLLHPMMSVPPGPSQYLFAWNRNSAQVLPLHAWLGRVEKRLFTTNKEDQKDTDRGRTDEVGTPRSAASPDLASNVRWEGWFKELAAQELPWKSYLTALFFFRVDFFGSAFGASQNHPQKSWLLGLHYHLLAVSSWASHTTCQCSALLFGKVKIINSCLPEGRLPGQMIWIRPFRLQGL